MATKKILMACGNYWTSTFQVGSHHLAKAFAQNGYQVAFISDPISPLHLAYGISPELRDRYTIYQQGGSWNKEHTIWAYIPGALATPHNKPILRSEWLQNNWHKFTMPNLINRVKENGFDSVDLLYFDSINQAFWLEAISYQKSIFRIADNLSAFSKATNATARQERFLSRHVDDIVYTAKSLEPFIKKLTDKEALFFPNGVNYEHFAKKHNIVPIEYEIIKSPIALYVGAMDTWFDYACINTIAQALPDVSFVLIGPDYMAKQRLLKLPNIHLLGRRPYEDLPPYLQHADLGIIPFDRKNHANLVDHINPLKLYEYMAAGLPVISIRWQELENLQTPAKLADSDDDFIRLIKQTLSEPRESVLLQKFAKKFDWTERVQELL